MAELSGSTLQHREEMDPSQSQGQRHTAVPELQRGEARTCQDTGQQELEPARVLATIQELQLDLDLCRGRNHERLLQLRQQEGAAEQRLQDLVVLMEHCQGVLGKEQRDMAVQTEAISTDSCGGPDADGGLLREHLALSEQVAAGAETKCCPWTWGKDAPLGKQSTATETQGWEEAAAAPVPAQLLPAHSCLQCPGADTQREDGCAVQAELRALQEQVASSKAELARSRQLVAGLRAELIQSQQKQRVTLEQALRYMHAAAHAEQKLQRSHEQVQALREQVEDVAILKAELAQAQTMKAKQDENIAAYEEQRQQLHWELRNLQGAQEQSKQQAHSLQERLQKLGSQAQHWQQLHQDSEQALAMREEELVVCKVDLAFLKAELSRAMEQIKTLRASHTCAGSDSNRLHQERNLVLVNISQCVKEQMQSHEKQGAQDPAANQAGCRAYR